MNVFERARLAVVLEDVAREKLEFRNFWIEEAAEVTLRLVESDEKCTVKFARHLYSAKVRQEIINTVLRDID